MINCRRTIKVEKCLKHKKEELTIAEAFISTPMAKFRLQWGSSTLPTRIKTLFLHRQAIGWIRHISLIRFAEITVLCFTLMVSTMRNNFESLVLLFVEHTLFAYANKIIRGQPKADSVPAHRAHAPVFENF